MSGLFTAFALLCALVSVGAAWLAVDQARELSRSRARLTENEHEIAALSALLHKLRQKVYSQARQAEAPAPPPDVATPDGSAPLCENYASAQLLGPKSDAAKCECGYCTEMRVRRQQEKAAILKLQQRGAPRPAKGNGGE